MLNNMARSTEPLHVQSIFVSVPMVRLWLAMFHTFFAFFWANQFTAENVVPYLRPSPMFHSVFLTPLTKPLLIFPRILLCIFSKIAAIPLSLQRCSYFVRVFGSPFAQTVRISNPIFSVVLSAFFDGIGHDFQILA